MYKNAHDILRINNVFVFFSNKYWIGCKNIKKKNIIMTGKNNKV